MATFASIVGTQLPEDAAEDSFSFLPIFQGAETFALIRPYTLHQTISLALAIRRGPGNTSIIRARVETTTKSATA